MWISKLSFFFPTVWLGNASTTTTVIDNKNGAVPKSPGKVLKRTVTEDIVTTFSSPAAWLLVIALIVTWSAVAVVMFDLVDYKNFSGKIYENLAFKWIETAIPPGLALSLLPYLHVINKAPNRHDFRSLKSSFLPCFFLLFLLCDCILTDFKWNRFSPL